MKKAFAVITTIQNPTPSIELLLKVLAQDEIPLIIAGDRKGPDQFEGKNVSFLSIDEQINSSFKLAELLPENHYGRKNIGYLQAFKNGAEVVYETDDDNAPLENWVPRALLVEAMQVEKSRWVNAYRFFTKDRIWPRGFPLDEIVDSCQKEPSYISTVNVSAPIQQGLANNSPDVDAVWRLVMDQPFDFEEGPSIYLPPGAWCPFNSQSTWWWPKAYPLMYLPSYCSFRMTDIWRSFIAQRCLWELGYGLVFHAPEVVQDRNPHNLMRDFNDEIPGYQRNRELVKVLERLDLKAGDENVGFNLRACYEALITREFFPEKELVLVDSWLNDLDVVLKK